jgi:hypothetical protein
MRTKRCSMELLVFIHTQKVHIDIDPNAKPVHSRPYPVPQIHLKTFKMELDYLVRIGVLAPQQESEWASPLVGNSNFCFQFLGPSSEAEFRFRFHFRIFQSENLFRNLLLKSHQIRILIPKFGIPEFCSHRNSVHLILYQKTIAISFLAKNTSTYSTCKTSRCHFGGQNNHAAKSTSTQNE